MTDVSALERLFRRVVNVVSRGRVTLVDDTKNCQTLQVKFKNDVVRDKVARMQEYGFTSVPPADTDCVTLFLSGEAAAGIVIATNNQRFRLKSLRNGDVALYDNRGQAAILSDTGIELRAPVVSCSETLKVGNGASGTFTTTTGQTVTVQDGIVTNIY